MLSHMIKMSLTEESCGISYANVIISLIPDECVMVNKRFSNIPSNKQPSVTSHTFLLIKRFI